MIILKDQMNETIRLEKTPERIVSLVPSQTELLHYFNLDKEVIGITKFCVHPNEWFQNKLKVGGTKKVNHEIIDSLKPDLIIGNKEENTQEDIEILKEKYPVYMSDIYTCQDAFRMILDIGILVDKKNESEKLIANIKSNFTSLPIIRKRILYFIWNDPYMAVGRNTFIGDMIEQLGMINCLQNKNERYPIITQNDLQILNPDIIILSSEPFPFKEIHINELQKISSAKIKLVDGEMFSWYGSRMKEFPNYVQRNLHF